MGRIGFVIAFIYCGGTDGQWTTRRLLEGRGAGGGRELLLLTKRGVHSVIVRMGPQACRVVGMDGVA